MSATPAGDALMRSHRIGCLALLFLALVAPCSAVATYAQQPPLPAPVLQWRMVDGEWRAGSWTSDERVARRSDDETAEGSGRAARTVKFLLGGAAGLGVHESGHLTFDGLLGVRPTLKRVDFGGIPFFAITHEAGLSDRREFTISSAGFWMQHLSSEILLTRHPRLAGERAPVLKGWLAFNILASVAYGTAALAKAGPSERDTRGMADTLHVNEPWVGALVLIPAGLDAWRYSHPDARWARWLSRGVKVGSVLLVIK